MADGKQTEEAPKAASKPDSKRVKIERVTGQEPITGLTIPRGDGPPDHWHPPVETTSFEVDADTAVAAVATGAFKQAADSGAKLKNTAAKDKTEP